MNHLIFSAVLTACLGIGGHQYSHQHGPYNKPPDEYFYKEPAQLYSSKTYSWPTLVLSRSTQHIAIYSFVFYVLTYFASNFGGFNVHVKVFRWMMTVYPILMALMGFQVTNLVPYLARILHHFMGLYRAPCSFMLNPYTGPCLDWVPGIKLIAWSNLVCLGRAVAMVSENTDFHLSKQAGISLLQGATTMMFNRGGVWVVT
ncbi:hypothetical protein DSO57_1035059 [Entomophthora muscae]|uniref:Uncharacterized protein n=1 Tax=Entomophthora muscae TaxID=34485 RepID=A0ACC2S1L7_9FUNG|nr:hypothetical protein DSO57_1035059 [Entomophthora muscae]